MIIGTAGHIDHGKTELIKALTHIDTDRLKEEKERKMSIELGFAWFDLPKAGRVGIIDVPGHIKFLKNMLAGVGGVDVTLLVVAADEGIMPQTREHFKIMRLLGVKKMIVVITKKDLVDEETVELAKEDIKELLASYQAIKLLSEQEERSPDNVPIVVVSSKTREGLDILVKELDEVCSSLAKDRQDACSTDISRLLVDRVFEMKGFGTIVTGTLVSGKISQGDELFIYPEGIKAKVRFIQIHYERRKEALSGERVALNLTGIKKEKIKRGYVISKEGYLKATKRATIIFHILPSVKVLKNRTRVRFYIGSAEILGRISLLGAKEKKGGEKAFAQLLLETAGTFFVGDRFVLRNYSPLQLIGGGKILDISPEKSKKLDIPKLDAIEKEGISAAVLMKLEDNPQKEGALLSEIGLSLELLRKTINKLKEEGKVIIFGDYITDIKTFGTIKESILSTLSDFYKKYPLRTYILRSELRQKFPMGKEIFDEIIPKIEELKCEKEKVSLKVYKPVLQEKETAKKNALEQEFLKSEFKPPEPESSEAFRALIEDGIIVGIGKDIFLHKEVLEKGKEKIAELIKNKGDATISEIKNVLDTSRKYMIPLMEYLDSIGFTKRAGDKRILGE